MTEPYKLSNSELQTYKDCRRRWWFGYYRKLQPKAQKFTGPLQLGSRIHAALDEYYTTGKPLISVYSDLIEADRNTAMMAGVDPSELDGEAELGQIMLKGYLQWAAEEGIDANFKIVSTEEILSMPMLDGEVELQGKLDMRVKRKSDGVRMFRDFKTSANFSQVLGTAHMNEQILTYMLLEASQVAEEDRSEGGIFTMLKKVKRGANAKPPFYQQFEVRHNVFTVRSFWQRIHGTITDLMNTKKALDAGVSHLQVAYPRPTADCTWKCPFYMVCPLVDDGSAAEEMIADLYEEHNPYDYYGQEEPKGGE